MLSLGRYVFKYFRNVLVSFDRFVNAIMGGSDLETISSRIYRIRNKYWWTKAIYKLLNNVDKNHCEESLEPEDHYKNKEVWK